MAAGLKGLVISNCQAHSLAQTLNLFCKGISFDAFGIHLIAPRMRQSAVDRFVSEAGTKYDVVFAVPLAKDFQQLSADRLNDTFAGRVVATVPNFYFTGLHPDLTYLGSLGQRLVGPLGDYHSKIAILSYANGLSREAAAAMYCESVFRKLDYFGEFARSLAEMERRDQTLSIPFAQELAAILKQEVCFLSVNHPTSYLFANYSIKLSNWLTERGLTSPTRWFPHPATLVNHLASSSIFPIFPEIAAACELQYPGSYAFKPPATPGTPVNCIDLEEFIDLEYQYFSAVTHQQFLSVPQIASLIKCSSF